MKLSQEAVDDLLHIIEGFDRERGVPHNYFDLERTLLSVVVGIDRDKDGEQKIFIVSPKKPPI